jgi:sensor histidine kinase YesM
MDPAFRPNIPSKHPDFPLQSDGKISPFEIVRFFGIYSRSSQFLVVFIISYGLKVVSQWYAEKQRLQELENSMVQAELSFLKSQIHPHFLFNSLNSIYYLALSKDDKAPEVILSLSDFLRFVTTESNQNRIPLEKEVKMLEEYVHLQSLRASEKFELQFQLKGDFQEKSIMPLTFVPFVENAFKYGISAHINCFIHICVEIENDILKFTCDNSIVSRINDRSHSAGIGLENIRKRLELAYPGLYSLAINSDSQAFHVKLQINLA